MTPLVGSSGTGLQRSFASASIAGTPAVFTLPAAPSLRELAEKDEQTLFLLINSTKKTKCCCSCALCQAFCCLHAGRALKFLIAFPACDKEKTNNRAVEREYSYKTKCINWFRNATKYVGVLLSGNTGICGMLMISIFCTPFNRDIIMESNFDPNI